MLFSSVMFLFMFLPVTLAVYYLVSPKFRNMVMLIASLFFYAWGEPVYIILMMLLVIMNYFCGLDIDGVIAVFPKFPREDIVQIYESAKKRGGDSGREAGISVNCS